MPTTVNRKWFFFLFRYCGFYLGGANSRSHEVQGHLQLASDSISVIRGSLTSRGASLLHPNASCRPCVGRRHTERYHFSVVSVAALVQQSSTYLVAAFPQSCYRWQVAESEARTSALRFGLLHLATVRHHHTIRTVFHHHQSHWSDIASCQPPLSFNQFDRFSRSLNHLS